MAIIFLDLKMLNSGIIPNFFRINQGNPCCQKTKNKFRQPISRNQGKEERSLT